MVKPKIKRGANVRFVPAHLATTDVVTK